MGLFKELHTQCSCFLSEVLLPFGFNTGNKTRVFHLSVFPNFSETSALPWALRLKGKQALSSVIQNVDPFVPSDFSFPTLGLPLLRGEDSLGLTHLVVSQSTVQAQSASCHHWGLDFWKARAEELLFSPLLVLIPPETRNQKGLGCAGEGPLLGMEGGEMFIFRNIIPVHLLPVSNHKVQNQACTLSTQQCSLKCQ